MKLISNTPQRHLTSPQEVVASLRRAVSDGPAVHVHSRVWPEIQFVDLSFAAAGTALVGPIGFYSVATIESGSAMVSPHGGAHAHRARQVTTGATLIHGVSEAYEYSWDASHRTTLSCLDPSVVKRAAAETGISAADHLELARVLEDRDPACDHLVKVLAQEAKLAAHPAQLLIVESVASALACHLLARVSAESHPARLPGALGTRPFQLVRAYIEDNVGERISLEDLARIAGISRFHFARQFRLRTGESPMGYLLRVRIDRAKTMLRAADTRVAEIAATLGFADQSHFTRTFRRMVGMPPSSFAIDRPRASGQSPDRGTPGKLDLVMRPDYLSCDTAFGGKHVGTHLPA